MNYCRKNRFGFTLIELVVVLLIFSVALGVVGILINRRSGSLELKTFTKHISATLRYARNRAISEKKTYSFIILKETREYGLYADPSSKTANDNAEENDEEKYLLRKTIPEQLDIEFESMNEYLKIDFYPRGSSSGGSFDIRNQKGRKLSIIVNKITGMVKIKKLQN